MTFSLGDVVFGVSSNSWRRLAVALAVDVQFLAPAEPGDVLVATSTERHRTLWTSVDHIGRIARPRSGRRADG